MKISDEPPYSSSIARLDSSTRQIVLSLLAHPIVRRLRGIQQLGYASRVFKSATHTRWAHTLWTVDTLCCVLEVAASLPLDVKAHLLAAAVMQDIGHSPYSNSLSQVFAGEWTAGPDSYLFPIDKVRTILIVQHVENTERLFYNLGLQLPILIQLLAGHSPWPKNKWVARLIEGVLDADRLAYVPHDSILTKQQPIGREVKNLARSFLYDGPFGVTLIDGAGVESAQALLIKRGQLSMNVYYHPQKLAWERIMADLIDYMWRETLKDAKATFGKPVSVQEFLDWDDSRVEGLVEEARVRKDRLLEEFFRHLNTRSFFVAEVEPMIAQSLSLSDIGNLLSQLVDPFPKSLSWIIGSSSLPEVSIYTPGSIEVRQKGTYEPFEWRVPTFSGRTKFRKHTLIIATFDQIKDLTTRLNAQGLALGPLQTLTMS